MFLLRYNNNNYNYNNIKSTSSLLLSSITSTSFNNKNSNNNKFFSTSSREEGSVEKEWWKPTENLSEALEKSRNEKKPLFVFLEGPSGSGKQQLIERLSNIGYKTISDSYFKHSLKSTSTSSSSPSSSFDNNLNESINSLLLKKEGDSIDEIKNNLIFIHRSPISSIIYNNNNNDNDSIDSKIKKIKNLILKNQNDYNSIYIYCKTPIELIEQRLAGRYHFYEDNETELLEKLNIKDHQELSYEIYNQLEQQQEKENQIFSQTLDTTSVKQACPSLLAFFNIYFNLSTFKIPNFTKK